MRSVIVPIVSFRLFDTVVQRLDAPLQDSAMFAEFSSLVETMLLSDSIYFLGPGATSFEWASGDMLPDKKITPHNQFEAFQGIDFISQAPFEHMMAPGRKDLIRVFGQRMDGNVVLNSETITDLISDRYCEWSYLTAYAAGYNGLFGPVVIKEYPLIKDILPDAISYCDSNESVSKDTLINKSYSLLKEKYSKKLEAFNELDLMRVVIPPLTATLLSRFVKLHPKVTHLLH